MKTENRARTAAFVGDEINDAPALAEADVGLAVSTGTDISIEVVDVVLMLKNLMGAHAAIYPPRGMIWAFQSHKSVGFGASCATGRA